VRVMPTGVDFKEGQNDPLDTTLLQVMPWPVSSKMTDGDLRAIHDFLRAVPPHDGAGCTPGGPWVPPAGRVLMR
jgi:hypothetical protein